MLNQYLKIKKIAEGPYSKIKLMKNVDTGTLLAMKKYNLFILKKKNKLLKKEKGVRTPIPIQPSTPQSRRKCLRRQPY